MEIRRCKKNQDWDKPEKENLWSAGIKDVPEKNSEVIDVEIAVVVRVG